MRKEIRTMNKLNGFIDELSDRIEIRDIHNRIIVVFRKAQNETRNASGGLIGKGDLTSRYIPA